MKKIILICSFLFMTVVSFAQMGSMLSGIPTAAGGRVSGIDSVRVNGTTAGYLYIQPSLTATKCGSFQINLRRVTASMNGSVTLQASNDGINYFATAATDTVHIDNGATDVDKITIPPATGLPYHYYRVKGVNLATTDTCTMRAFWNGRQ